MKIANKHKNFYTLSFIPGEDVITGLVDFANENNIHAGHITGIGATNNLTLGYYDLNKKEYSHKEFREHLEILSLTGNISINEKEENIIHIHGVFGKSDFHVIGGHVFKLVISGAGEIHITTLPGEIKRAKDDNTGLSLMQ